MKNAAHCSQIPVGHKQCWEWSVDKTASQLSGSSMRYFSNAKLIFWIAFDYDMNILVVQYNLVSFTQYVLLNCKHILHSQTLCCNAMVFSQQMTVSRKWAHFLSHIHIWSKDNSKICSTLKLQFCSFNNFIIQCEALTFCNKLSLFSLDFL